jgi:mRNA-degrading endonuclease RelE of RelBE toxin-antitoxin system
MRFKILLHRRAFEFLRDLKSDERQRIIKVYMMILGKSLSDQIQLDVCILITKFICGIFYGINGVKCGGNC